MPGTQLRLEHLRKNVERILSLLSEYEHALMLEDDPRRQARYRRNIEELRQSSREYQEEYEFLVAGAPQSATPALTEIRDQLRFMTFKLDEINQNQTQFTALILQELNASEREIVSAVVARLDIHRAQIVSGFIAALENNQVRENELIELVSTLHRTLLDVTTGPHLAALPPRVKEITEVIQDPTLDIKHKLRISVPIIPLLLSYTAEISVNSGINLEKVWQRLLNRLHLDK